jgi:signal transduction histidine kinase
VGPSMTSFARTDITPPDRAIEQSDVLALFGVAFERSVPAMLLLDANVEIVAANPAAHRFLARGQLIGSTLAEFGADDNQHGHRATMATLADSKDRVQWAAKFIIGSGGPVNVDVQVDAVIGRSGNRVYLVQLASCGGSISEPGRSTDHEYVAAVADRAIVLRRVSDLLATARGGIDELLRNVADLAASALGEGVVLRVLTPDLLSIESDVVAHVEESGRLELEALAAASLTGIPPHHPVIDNVINRGRFASSVGRNNWRQEDRQRFGEWLCVSAEQFIAAPLRHHGEVLGLFVVYRTDNDEPYVAADEDLVQVLADGVGAAIAEARARDVMERDRDRRLRELVDRQRELLDQLAEMETRERSLLAEVIHDEPIQLIVAAILRVDNLSTRQSTADAEELDRAATLLETAVEGLRNLIAVRLTPADLSIDLGIALRDLVEGIFVGTVTFRMVGDPQVSLTDAAKGAAYRILREALVNVHQHARAMNVTIRFDERDGMVVFVVTDDGLGADHFEAGSGHLGLATRARAAAEGGQFQITGVLGEGTTVTLSLPASTGRLG